MQTTRVYVCSHAKGPDITEHTQHYLKAVNSHVEAKNRHEKTATHVSCLFQSV